MTFTTKVSGTRVDDFDIIPLFDTQQITLSMVMNKVTRQETMDWLLDNLRFLKGLENDWYAIIDWDSIYKVSILENYPEYEKEMINQFGENWLSYYIRFKH